MKPYRQRLQELMDRTLGRFRKLSSSQVESAGQRVLERLRKEPEWETAGGCLDFQSVATVWKLRWPAVALAAAAIAIAVFLPARVYESAPAVLEDVVGFRDVHFGEIVSPKGVEGGTLKLHGGSRVEMRSQSELSLERATDGVRILIRKGDVIVDSAEQSSESVIVETKDLSAVGKVFLVNAKEEGSHVAAIGGEARVQQGGAERRLSPGEQLATNPGMPPLSLTEEIGWSRQLERIALLLLQARPQIFSELQSRLPQAPARGKETFLLAKVRVSPPPAFSGGRGGGALPVCSPSPAFFPKVDPSRFYFGNITLYQMILTAYTDFHKCEPTFHEEDHISSGPAWIRTDRFEIEANFPDGSPAGKEYAEGKRAKVQEMLQALLEDRFKLVLRPQQKEMQVYLLKLAEGGARLTPAQPADAFGIGFYPARYSGPPFGHEQILGPGGFNGGKSSSSDIASSLSALLRRPVFDRTGLAGLYTFHAEWVPTVGQQGFERIQGTGLTGPTIFEAVQTLGLRLESTKSAVGFIIERAEKPSEN